MRALQQATLPAEAGSRRRRAVDRAVEARRAVYDDEVRRLIDAGFAVVRKTGNLDPRIGEIVAAADLSNQAFYRHFPSKNDLLLAMLDEGIRRLRGYVEHRMEKAPDPLAKIRAGLDAILEQALRPQAAAATRPFALSRGRLAEVFPQEVAATERQLTQLFEAAIAKARKDGALPLADPARDAQLLYGLAMGWVERRLADPNPSGKADAAHLVAFALRGLARDDAKPATRRPTTKRDKRTEVRHGT
ncbi:MAG: TetR/AcrR family transcriptional regulator [Deltaproteobacteria bacterium]